jgi:hypothetical protein
MRYPTHAAPAAYPYNRLSRPFEPFRADETGLPDPVNTSLSLAMDAMSTIELLSRFLHNSRLDSDDRFDGQPLHGYDEGVLMQGIAALCTYAQRDLSGLRDWLLRQVREPA